MNTDVSRDGFDIINLLKHIKKMGYKSSINQPENDIHIVIRLDIGTIKLIST